MSRANAIPSHVASSGSDDGAARSGRVLIETLEPSVRPDSPATAHEQIRRIICEVDFPAWRITEYGDQGDVTEQRGWTGEAGYVADFAAGQVVISQSPRLEFDDRWLIELVGRSPSHVGLCSTELLMMRRQDGGDDHSPSEDMRLVLGDGATTFEIDRDDMGDMARIRTAVGIAGEPAPFIETIFAMDRTGDVDVAHLTEIVRDRSSGVVLSRRHVAFRLVEVADLPRGSVLYDIPKMPHGMSVVDNRYSIVFQEGDAVVRTASREIHLRENASAANVHQVLAGIQGSHAAQGIPLMELGAAITVILAAALLYARRRSSCPE